MSANATATALTTVAALAEGNDHELDLLKTAKEGFDVLVDGLLSGAFRRKCALEGLDELLENQDLDGERNQPVVTVHSDVQAAQTFRNAIKECNKAIEKSYDRCKIACQNADDEYERRKKAGEIARKRNEASHPRMNLLLCVAGELEGDHAEKLRSILVRVYNEEHEVYHERDAELHSENSEHLKARRNQAVKQARWQHKKEESTWLNQKRAFELAAESHGIQLDS